MQVTQSFSPPKKIFKCLEILEKDVKQLVNFIDCISLRLNADKLEFIVFGSKESKVMSVTIEGQKIKEETEVKYLGFTIYKKLTFQSEVKKYFTKYGTRRNINLYIAELSS